MRLKTKIFLVSIASLLVVAFIFRNLIVSFYFIALSYLTSPDLSYIKEKTWTYNNGFALDGHDFISFKDSNFFQLRSDTIYYKGLPKAVIKRLSKHFYEMTIVSIDGKQTGSYTNIEEFTH